jgi:hypothetical protein
VNTGIVEKIEFVILDTLDAVIAVTRNHEETNIDSKVIINKTDDEQQSSQR